MRYWSKGLGKRSAIYIDWSKGQYEVTLDGGLKSLSSVIAPNLLRGELPTDDKQVIVSGTTAPPIEWRYVAIFTVKDLKEMIKLANRPAASKFVAHSPKGFHLFLRLTWLFMGIIVRYIGTLTVTTICRLIPTAKSQSQQQPPSDEPLRDFDVTAQAANNNRQNGHNVLASLNLEGGHQTDESRI
jgi:hypothetical protein